MTPDRVPILVNSYERAVDGQLALLCERYGVRVYAKVRVADALPVDRDRLDGADFSYALKSHFDFVLADAQTHDALLAVEFDGPTHRDDPKVIERDQRKDRICRQYYLPFLRLGAPALRRADHRTLLEWVLEVWLEHRRLCQQQVAYEESEGELNPPDIDPDEFQYGTAYDPLGSDEGEQGLQRFAPLDCFADAREYLGRWIWKRLGHPTYDGWYGHHERGHEIGVCALEVGPGAWLIGRGGADLRGLWPWTPALLPVRVAQDLALLDLRCQLEAWERGRILASSRDAVDEAKAGLKWGPLSQPTMPSRDELMWLTLDAMRESGFDTDEPGVFLHVYRSFHDRDDAWRED